MADSELHEKGEIIRRKLRGVLISAPSRVHPKKRKEGTKISP